MTTVALPSTFHHRLVYVATMALALVVSLALKDFYSRAGFDELLWILAPTTGLVEWVSGVGFELESHRGYLNRELLYQIGPSCSGVNFMIAMFCTLVCGLVHTRRTFEQKLAFVPICGLTAYGVTVLANAVRISIAIYMHKAVLGFGFLTAERLHRVEGIAVYFFFLCVTFAIAARCMGANREPARR